MVTPLQIIAPYDGRTRYLGVSASLDAWTRIAATNSNTLTLERRFSDGIHFQVEEATRRALRVGQCPLLLGGDHSLTWSAVRSVFDRYGQLTIIHFDAHQDAHPVAEINHWSVFSHIGKKFAKRIIPIGHRAGCALVSSELCEIVTTPVYITLDVDYFDPALVPGVSSPVTGPIGMAPDFNTFSASLANIRGPILGADIVEWKGAQIDSDEFAFVARVYQQVYALIQRNS